MTKQLNKKMTKQLNTKNNLYNGVNGHCRLAAGGPLLK